MAKKKKEMKDFDVADKFVGYATFYDKKADIKKKPNEQARDLAICHCKDFYESDPKFEKHYTMEGMKSDCILGAKEAFKESQEALIKRQEKKITKKEAEIKIKEEKIAKKDSEIKKKEKVLIEKQLEDLEWQMGTMSEGTEYKEARQTQKELQDKLDELEKKHKTKNKV